MPETKTNQDWIKELSQTGLVQDDALARLRDELERGMPYALSRWLTPNDPHFDSLIQESIQEALVQVLEKLKSFRGESKFTTWVYKIAIRKALSELRRKRWEDVSLDGLIGHDEGLPVLERLQNPDSGPELHVTQRDMLNRIGTYLKEELTDKQRKALIAVSVKGMPTSEVARRMGTNRNALYKLLHDARLKLKGRLLQEGLEPEDVLAIFDS